MSEQPSNEISVSFPGRRIGWPNNDLLGKVAIKGLAILPPKLCFLPCLIILWSAHYNSVSTSCPLCRLNHTFSILTPIFLVLPSASHCSCPLQPSQSNLSLHHSTSHLPNLPKPVSRTSIPSAWINFPLTITWRPIDSICSHNSLHLLLSQTQKLSAWLPF